MVIGRQYFTQQAKTLLNFARSTTDPCIAAALIEKAVDLKSKFDDAILNGDDTPLAPHGDAEL
jgi:hypothetical protein